MTRYPPRALHVPGLIARKRDGGELQEDELDALLSGYLEGEVPEYQMAAFLMAVVFRGLTDRELERWTRRLIESGERWTFPDVPGPKVDKHSTGGVGDKVSLVLAPLAAALGLKVPMVSGRGLGHTGGTLDKLEAIPGIRTDLSRADFERLLGDVGFAMGGQTRWFAPLDRELYALRDVTATVESLPLIAASIISKKAAEGLDALVLDVKTGAGAFLDEEHEAEELARLMLRLAAKFDLRAEAVLTGMDEPLGFAVGHALEVREALDTLRGEGPPDLVEVTVALTVRLLVMVGAAPDDKRAEEMARRALEDGSALDRFRRWVEAQGGDARVVDSPDMLPRAAVTRDVVAEHGGHLQVVDVREVGLVVVDLGGGRRRKGDQIDPAVGVVLHHMAGAHVERGERLATVHAAFPDAAEIAARRLGAILQLGEDPLPPRPLVRKRISL